MGENIAATWSNRPLEYSVPLPEAIRQFITSIQTLPTYTVKDGEFVLADDPTHYCDYTIISISDIFYVASSASEYMTPGAGIEDTSYSGKYLFIDPYSNQLVMHSPFDSDSTYVAKFNRGKYTDLTGYNKVENIEYSLKYPGRFYGRKVAGTSAYYNGGAAAFNKETKTYIDFVVAPVIAIEYRAKGKYYNSNFNNVLRKVFNLETLYSFANGINTSNGAVPNTWAGEVYYRNVPNINITNSFIIDSSNRGFYTWLIDTLPIAFPTYNYFNGGIVPVSYYDMWYNIIFVDSLTEYNNLPEKSEEELEEERDKTKLEIEDLVNPYLPGGESGPAGGDGNFGRDEESDDISVDLPFGSVEGDSSGTYTRYLVNSSQLELFGEWLWTTDLGLAIAKSVISLIYGDPSESLIGLISFPFNLEAMQGMSTSGTHLFWGHHDSGLAATAVRNAAVRVDWGSIQLSEYWGNFLDYSPHTKIDLYLPWGTGFVSIDPGQCLPGSLHVITNIELSKGSCVHNVIGNNGCVIGSYSGQCGKQLPLISSDFASKIAGTVTAAAAGIAAGAVSGGIAASQAAAYHNSSNLHWGGTPIKFTGVERGKYQDYAKFGAVDPSPYINNGAGQISNAIKTAGKIATSSLAINRSPVHVSRNGGFTDGSASLGIQYPYIILSRPSQNMPKEYGKFYGYPSNIYSKLGQLKGYTEVGEIHLKNIPATNDEILEIDRLLKNGVIF